MIVKIFDVAHGSSSFVISPTGMTELVDLGARGDWSPLDHIYRYYIPAGQRLARLTQTHHHGDHLDDVYNLTPQRMPSQVVRRLLDGRYLQACQSSNSPTGQQKALHFDRLFRSYTEGASPNTAGASAWGIEITGCSLTVQQSDSVSSTDNSTVNSCSYMRLYNHNGTKVLICGDMEKEGMALLLALNSYMRSAVSGVNVLVAPHHGHSSGFSTELMRAIGKPNIVVASVMSGDAHVDSRYSSAEWVTGVQWEDGSVKRLLTTRSHGAIHIGSSGYGAFQVTTGKR